MFKSLIPLALLTFSISSLAGVGGGGMPVITFSSNPTQVTPSPGGKIGSLSWDGSSSFIENSANGKRYLQLGLLKNYTYEQTLDAISSRGKWSDFHLATIDEAYEFANAVSSIEFKNNPDSPIDTFRADTKNAFEDGVLGNSYNSGFDRFFYFSNPSEKMVGILDLHSGTDQVYFSELFGTYDRYWFARYAQYGSQETGSWLLVSNYTLPTSVPEPINSAMLLAGLGLLGIAVRRAK